MLESALKEELKMCEEYKNSVKGSRRTER